MSIWLDFLQVALALGIGWLGWVLLALTRPPGLPPALAPSRRGVSPLPSRPGAPVMRGQAADGDR